MEASKNRAKDWHSQTAFTKTKTYNSRKTIIIIEDCVKETLTSHFPVQEKHKLVAKYTGKMHW